jgi:hypothetical protein
VCQHFFLLLLHQSLQAVLHSVLDEQVLKTLLHYQSLGQHQDKILDKHQDKILDKHQDKHQTMVQTQQT